MTITLSAIDPTSGQQDVLTTANVDLNIDDDTGLLDLSTAIITFTRGDIVEIAYTGGAYQAPWSGDVPTGDGTSQLQFRNIVRVGGFFEDNDINVRVQCDNDLAQSLDDNYDFEIETLGFLGNSEFEAPGAASTDAKGWTLEGAERQRNPPSWPSQPEGEHVVTLLDDVAFPIVSTVNRAHRETKDLTGVDSLKFTERVDSPVIDAGDTVDFLVFIEGDLVHSRQLTSADSGTDETNVRNVVTTGYTGVNEIRFVIAYTKAGEQLLFVEGAEIAVFDSASLEYEGFADWADTQNYNAMDYFNATDAVFNAGTNTSEDFTDFTA